jgi:hypothetical protein
MLGMGAPKRKWGIIMRIDSHDKNNLLFVDKAAGDP